jgi:hypothetical protein
MKKTFSILLVVLTVQWLTSADAVGQIKGARSYMNRLNGTPAAAPAPKPAPAPAPAAPAKPYHTPLPAVDPAKAQTEKEAQLQRTIEFQKKRAEDGSPTAQYDLGMRYLTGDRLDKDIDAAQKWLKEAAKNGNKDAEKKLAELKLTSEDTTHNEVKPSPDGHSPANSTPSADPKPPADQKAPAERNPSAEPK